MIYKTFRDAMLEKAPRWIKRGHRGNVLYTIGLHIDALVEMAQVSIRYRFPGHYSPESLPTTGRDRKVPRGRNESDATYADRLTRWLDYHRHRGNPYELLRKVREHYAPTAFAVDLVYAGSPLLAYTLRYHLAADGTITRHKVLRADWSPHGDPNQWARWWLFYHNPDLVTDVPTWGDGGSWGDGGVWGSSLPALEVEIVRTAPNQWNAARSIGRLVFLADGEDWDTHTPGEWPQQSYVDVGF